MKILVTGATGFIGGHVINELLKRNVEIIASSTSLEKAKQKSWFNQVSFIEHDMNDIDEVDLKIKFLKPDCIIHLAWNGLPNYEKIFHIEKELFLQYNFIKNIVSSGIENVNISGTCLEYGMQEGCLNETSNLPMPSNPYALAKDSLRKFLLVLQKTMPFSLKWLRLFYLYGSNQNANSLIPQLQSALDKKQQFFNMSLGDQIRDYLKIEDAAKFIVDVSIQTRMDGVINVSSNSPIKVLDLVTSYLASTNNSISLNLGYFSYPEYEPFAFWGDNSKLKSIINE
ncbi:MAG: NAD-dependent epimerase/dehydratase family protein [Chitinophagaceae bacterium]